MPDDLAREILDKKTAALYKMGDLFATDKNYILAILNYEKILRLDPNNLEVCKKLGEWYKLIGNDSESAKYLAMTVLIGTGNKVPASIIKPAEPDLDERLEDPEVQEIIAQSNEKDPAATQILYNPAIYSIKELHNHLEQIVKELKYRAL